MMGSRRGRSASCADPRMLHVQNIWDTLNLCDFFGKGTPLPPAPPPQAQGTHGDLSSWQIPIPISEGPQM